MEVFCFDNTLAFSYQDALVGVDFRKTIHLTARPMDLEEINPGSSSQSKVNAQVTLGEITASAPYFLYLKPPLSGKPHPGSDPISIGPSSHQPDNEGISFVRSLVSQQAGRIVLIVYDNIDVSVIVEVTEGCPATGPPELQSRPSRSRYVGKRAVALVPIEKVPLPIRPVKSVGLELRIYVTIGHKNIFPPIVVEIQEPRPPAEVLDVMLKACIEDVVSKSSILIVPVKINHIIGEVRLKNIEESVSVIIARGRSHPGLRHAVLVEGTASHDPDLTESSVTLIPVQQAGCRVAGHINIRQAPVLKIPSKDGKSIIISLEPYTRLLRDIGKCSILSYCGKGCSLARTTPWGRKIP